MNQTDRGDKFKQAHQMDFLGTQHEGINHNFPAQSSTKAQQATIPHLSSFPSDKESRTLNLDTLPIEIIHRITSELGSCTAVLALRCVCHALHHACSDVVIMKRILDRSSVQSPGSAQTSRPAWYYGALSLESPFLSWARYALAHEEMEGFIKDAEARDGNEQLRKRKMASWLPQLLALHYPLQADHEFELMMYLFSEFLRPGLGPKERQVLWFCRAAFKPPSRRVPSSPGSRALYHNRTQSLYKSWKPGKQGIAAVNAEEIVFEVQCALCRWRHKQPFNATHQLNAPLIGDMLPFSTTMTIPFPFLESSAADFATCHIQTMTSQAFLIGDEWVGHCNHALDRNLPDLPMCDIIFESYEESVKPGPIQLKGRGTDSVGDFTLIGEMSSHNGKVMLCKQYTNASNSWKYSGMMTPFGIAGKWCSLSGRRAGGLFWIWKAKWTQGSS